MIDQTLHHHHHCTRELFLLDLVKTLVTMVDVIVGPGVDLGIPAAGVCVYRLGNHFIGNEESRK